MDFKKQGFRTRGYDYDPLVSLALLCPDFLGWGSQGQVRWEVMKENNLVKFHQFPQILWGRWCSFPRGWVHCCYHSLVSLFQVAFPWSYEFIYINIVGQYPWSNTWRDFFHPQKTSWTGKSIPTLHGTLKKRTSNLIGYDPDPTFPTWYLPSMNSG